MAYSTANPPFLYASAVGGLARMWGYKSADPIATIDTTGYFSNAGSLGIKVGDPIYIYDTVNNLGYTSFFTATGNGTADIVNATVMTSTDTD